MRAIAHEARDVRLQLRRDRLPCQTDRTVSEDGRWWNLVSVYEVGDRYGSSIAVRAAVASHLQQRSQAGTDRPGSSWRMDIRSAPTCRGLRTQWRSTVLSAPTPVSIREYRGGVKPRT